MANVFFKRGLHAALPKTGTNGAFYLTTDTNRLYVCNSDGGPLVELNQSINTVTKMSDLPDGTTAAVKGQYYYITELNALAYHNGTDWVQINPNVTLKSKEQDTTVTVDTNSATIKHDVEDSDGNHSKGSFTVIAGNNVTITKDGDGFKIDSSYVDTNDNTTYTIGAESITNGAKVNLDASSDGTDSAVNIKGAGATSVKVENGEIVVSSTDNDTKYAMSVTVGSENKNVKVALSADGEEQDAYEVVAGTYIDDVKLVNGNIEINAANMYNTSASLEFDINGKLTMGVTDGNDTVTDEVTPEIKIGKNDESVRFNNGIADLSVYTMTEVDDLIEGVEEDFAQQLQVADALHYCGTVSQADKATKLDIIKAHNGDTYKASEIIYVDPQATPKVMFANKGDLIIADGTEDEETGLLTSGTWEVISSGDDQVIIGDITGNTYKVKDGTEVLAELELKTAGENLADVEWATSGSKLTGTIKHDGPGAANDSRTTAETAVAQTPNQSLTFTVVSGLTYDANGHVIGAQTKEITVVDTDTDTDTDTHNHLEAVVVSTSQSGTAVSIDTKVDMEDEDKNDSFAIDSSSLKLVAGEKKVSIDLEWGSF